MSSLYSGVYDGAAVRIQSVFRRHKAQLTLKNAKEMFMRIHDEIEKELGLSSNFLFPSMLEDCNESVDCVPSKIIEDVTLCQSSSESVTSLPFASTELSHDDGNKHNAPSGCVETDEQHSMPNNIVDEGHTNQSTSETLPFTAYELDYGDGKTDDKVYSDVETDKIFSLPGDIAEGVTIKQSSSERTSSLPATSNESYSGDDNKPPGDVDSGSQESLSELLAEEKWLEDVLSKRIQVREMVDTNRSTFAESCNNLILSIIAQSIAASVKTTV